MKKIISALILTIAILYPVAGQAGVAAGAITSAAVGVTPGELPPQLTPLYALYDLFCGTEERRKMACTWLIGSIEDIGIMCATCYGTMTECFRAIEVGELPKLCLYLPDMLMGGAVGTIMGIMMGIISGIGFGAACCPCFCIGGPIACIATFMSCTFLSACAGVMQSLASAARAKPYTPISIERS